MIVITGASGGLGGELAKLYKKDGKTVINVSRNPSEYADKNLIHDLTKGSEIEAAAAEILKINEPLEVLINCAGIYSTDDLADITEEEIKKNMATHVKAPILLTSKL